MRKISVCELKLVITEVCFLASHKNLSFLWSYFIHPITFIALEKCKKECDHKIWLKIFWCKVFCLLKMKITQFPNEFRLNFSFFKKLLIKCESAVFLHVLHRPQVALS